MAAVSAPRLRCAAAVNGTEATSATSVMAGTARRSAALNGIGFPPAGITGRQGGKYELAPEKALGTPAPRRDSIRPYRNHRIRFRSPSCRQIARHDRDHHEEDGYADERLHVRGPRFEKQRGNEARRGHRAEQPHHRTEQHECQAVAT